jgi:hypothetical protein
MQQEGIPMLTIAVAAQHLIASHNVTACICLMTHTQASGQR